MEKLFESWMMSNKQIIQGDLVDFLKKVFFAYVVNAYAIFLNKGFSIDNVLNGLIDFNLAFVINFDRYTCLTRTELSKLPGNV